MRNEGWMDGCKRLLCQIGLQRGFPLYEICSVVVALARGQSHGPEVTEGQ
jgi:hypothetical protein